MFETKGDKAQWRIVYDLVAGLEVGGTITYRQLSDVLGREFLDDRGPIYRATVELQRANRRTLAVVRGIGYRVVDAPEHEGLAKSHHRRARRQLKKSHARLTSADRSRLTAEQAKRIDSLELTVSRHEDMIRRLDTRVDKHEQAIKDGRRSTKELEARIEDLADRMKRAGIEVPAP